jgi:hypothetical protein
MRYLRVRWFHDLDDEPVLIFSELDDQGYETRKIEQYRSGRRDIAHAAGWTGSTSLSSEPLPTLDFINAQEEFEGVEIPASEFEEVWQEAWRWFDQT